LYACLLFRSDYSAAIWNMFSISAIKCNWLLLTCDSRLLSRPMLSHQLLLTLLLAAQLVGAVRSFWADYGALLHLSSDKYPLHAVQRLCMHCLVARLLLAAACVLDATYYCVY
jgi:hypothetical protein